MSKLNELLSKIISKLNISVKAEKQIFTEEQKAQVRENISALSADTKIPSKVSDLTNDKGYLTSYTEIDPTVPAWAKAQTKPGYTKFEVGLGNVDNTSDIDKPVSTAQKEAIDESVSDKLSFKAQELTSKQQAQVRTNIDAASKTDINSKSQVQIIIWEADD